jgi:hypothetical protein
LILRTGGFEEQRLNQLRCEYGNDMGMKKRSKKSRYHSGGERLFFPLINRMINNQR